MMKISAMRPGYLYFSIFIWLVSTGGRFSANFLEDVASFNDSMIGITFAVQMLISSFLGSVGSIYADRLELKYPNKGRLLVLASGLFLSTVIFMMHGIVRFFADEYEQHLLFVGFHFAIRVGCACFYSIIFPILDGVTLSYLKSRDGSVSYGKERLFGAVAWAISSILIGPLLDYYGFGIFFITAPAGCLVSLYTIAKFGQNCGAYEQIAYERHSDGTEMVEKKISAKENGKVIEDENVDDDEYMNEQTDVSSIYLLRVLISTVTACGFILSSLTLNMGTSVVENLIFLYFETLGGSFMVMGLTVVVTVVFEIPIFHYAPRLLLYFGAEKLQIIACVAYVIRVVAYTCIPKGRMIFVLFFEPLHGITYACSKTSSVEFAAKISPTGFESSSQGMISLILGIGSVVGVSLGGWIEESLGPQVLYRSYAGIVAIGLFIFCLTLSIDRRLISDNEARNDPRSKTKYADLSRTQTC